MTADAPMVQPLAAPVRGPAGLRALFEPLFTAIPDLRGDVVRWGETGDGVLVELRLHGTMGGRPIDWTVVDRIVLRGGTIAGRTSYFDPLPLIGAMLRAPRVSVKLLPGLLRRR
jgi:ketosteroid isomerase-like protein